MTPNRKANTVRIGSTALLATLLAACATAPRGLDVDERLVLPDRLQGTAPGIDPGESTSPRAGGLSRHATPTVQDASRRNTRIGDDPLPAGLGTTPITVNFDGIPLSAFVSEALGNLLDVPVRVAPEVASMAEPITLRTPEARRPAEVYRLVQQVLADYGVQVRVEDGLVQVRKVAEGAGDAPSMIANDRSGEAATGFRPVLQIYELEVVRATDAMKWLQSLFGREIGIETDEVRNA
ncbi:MAG TPA: hypothetical protein VFV33_03935, partial [Gemmatimonadaceae bacterium]|nr:hypothetical protein [Gemmatimonadaceae bacterium]